MRQHQLTVPAALKPPRLLFFVLHGCWGLSEEHASMQDHSQPQNLSVGTSPLGTFQWQYKEEQVYTVFPFEAKIEEVMSFNIFLMGLIFFTQADTHCSAFMPS